MPSVKPIPVNLTGKLAQIYVVPAGDAGGELTAPRVEL
jgi:hypothetical protein